MAEAAAFALSNVTHRIANCDVTVKPADPCDQPDFILNALDDDCLRVVFRKLGPKDLLNTADVCQRFNEQAKNVFSIKYRKLEIMNYTIFGDCYKDTVRALRNFGSSILSLKIGECYGPDVVRLIVSIALHCKELTLLRIRFEGNISHQPFDKLEKFKLITCSMGNNLKVSLGGCVEMKSLCLEDCHFDSNCFEQTFRKLEEARFIHASGFSEGSFHRFIALNPTLMKLSIKMSAIDAETICSANSIHCIVQNLSNLVDLELDSLCRGPRLIEFSKSVQSLGHLTSLKTLSETQLKCCIIRTIALAKNDVPIEQLKLYNGRIDNEAIKSMSLLKQMKNLELNYIDEHLIELAKELPQLQKLRLEFSPTFNLTTALKKMVSYATKLSHLTLKKVGRAFNVNVEDYGTLLTVVQNRPKKVHLLIEIMGRGSYVHVPRTTLTENRDWFYIITKGF